MDNTHRNRLTALIGTIVFHVLILVILCCVSLHYPPKPKEWPPKDTAEILFGGEYVILGNTPDFKKSRNARPAQSQAETRNDASGTDLTDEGTAGKPSNVITSAQESPMKVQKKETPEKTGPTKEELARQEKERQQKEAAAKINNRVKFNSDAGTGTGNAGSPDGNSTTGALSGAPGFNLKGRTAESWGNTRSTLSGKIIVRVRVNRQGKVTSAEYAGGEGPAAASKEIRQRCIQASLESRFSVNLDAQAEQTGTITWKFTD